MLQWNVLLFTAQHCTSLHCIAQLFFFCPEQNIGYWYNYDIQCMLWSMCGIHWVFFYIYFAQSSHKVIVGFFFFAFEMGNQLQKDNLSNKYPPSRMQKDYFLPRTSLLQQLKKYNNFTVSALNLNCNYSRKYLIHFLYVKWLPSWQYSNSFKSGSLQFQGPVATRYID